MKINLRPQSTKVTEINFSRQLSVKKPYTEFHTNSTDCLVAGTGKQTETNKGRKYGSGLQIRRTFTSRIAPKCD